MGEEIKIINSEYFQKIVDEFKESCENKTFELTRDYTDIQKNIKELLADDYEMELFKNKLQEILLTINKNYWGLNFTNLGFGNTDTKKYNNKQWSKLYNFLKNNNNNIFSSPEKDFIYGYQSTATVTPILHLMNMKIFPVINSVYLKFIKDFYNISISNLLIKYKDTKGVVLNIADTIKLNYFSDEEKDEVFKDIPAAELLDRLAFFYAQKQSSSVNIKNKNIIYYGPPGTGKTYTVLETIQMLTERNRKLYKMVQFHPSYSYEDFIEGIKPSGMDKNGNIKFDLVDGEFKKFCIEARQDKDNNYYFMIDEINRAELSRVFGEILFCLEYRLPNNIDDETKGLIRTPYATLLDEKLKNLDEEEIKKHTVYWNDDEKKSYFGIPENVYVIGTMNDIDRSIDSFDLALRRRFRWEYMNCDESALQNHLIKNKVITDEQGKYIGNCKTLNKYIADDLNLGKSYKIGHSYFMKVTDYLGNNKKITLNSQKQVWENHIEPLLFEYFRAQFDEKKAEDELKKSKVKFIPKNETNAANS